MFLIAVGSGVLLKQKHTLILNLILSSLLRFCISAARFLVFCLLHHVKHVYTGAAENGK